MKRFLKKYTPAILILLALAYFITKPFIHKYALDQFISSQNKTFIDGLRPSFYRYQNYEFVYGSLDTQGIVHGVSVFYTTPYGKIAIKAPRALLSFSLFSPNKIHITLEQPDILYYDDQNIHAELLPDETLDIIVGLGLQGLKSIDVDLKSTKILHEEFLSQFKALKLYFHQNIKNKTTIQETWKIQAFQAQTYSLCHYLPGHVFEIADIFVDMYPLSILSMNLKTSYEYSMQKPEFTLGPSVFDVHFPENMFLNIDAGGKVSPQDKRKLYGTLRLPKNAKIKFTIKELLHMANVDESWHDIILKALQPNKIRDNQTKTHYALPFSIKGKDIYIGPQYLFKVGQVPF
jgi:hypothetical protein